MRKLFFLFIPITILFNGCSDPEEPSGCQVGAQTYSIDKTWAYSTSPFQINVSGGCIPANSKVFVDQTVVDHTAIIGGFSFSLPATDKDSIVISLKNGNTILFEQKIAFFALSGTWTEVSPFPGEAREQCVVVSYNGKTYLAGGSRNMTSSTPTYYGDYYSLNTSTNQWSQMGNSDLLKGVMLNATVNADILYFANQATSKSISVNTGNSVAEVATLLPNARWASLHNVAYQIRNPIKAKIIIEKFSATNGTWEEVIQKTHSYGTEDYIITGPAFSYEEKIYFTTYTSAHGDFWSFEPGTSKLELISAMDLKYFMNSVTPRFLFAKNGLFYFMEGGGIGTDVNGILVSSGKPGSFLLIYNIRTNEWIESKMQFPEQFRTLISYTANNKLFAGMSSNVTEGLPRATGVSHSKKIYEFKPE